VCSTERKHPTGKPWAFVNPNLPSCCSELVDGANPRALKCGRLSGPADCAVRPATGQPTLTVLHAHGK
jgi:hypothetical protein